MANVFHIENTDGSLTLTLKPGALNGPGGAQRDTDMRLYGMGALMWGEGVDENILRLTENFACDEKTSNPGVPKDEGDFPAMIVGLGINNPITGQTWYNKTDETLYVYTGAVWKRTSTVRATTTVPANATQGDLWYDLSVTTGCAQPTLKIYDPAHPDADGNGYVEISWDRVSTCGDAMSGELSMSPDGGTTRYRITDLADPVDLYDAVHLDYVTTLFNSGTAALTAHTGDLSAHLTTAQNTFLDALETNCPAVLGSQLASDLCELAGYSINTGTIYDDVNGDGTPGTGKVDRSGDTMTGFLNLHADPATGLQAATKQYVDNKVPAPISTGSLRFVSYFNSISTGVPQDGDIATVGAIIYIYNSGWKQVFPPLYT